MRGPLYATPQRLAQRTSALHRAKIGGADAAATIAALTDATNPDPRRLADIGCGRGTTTARLVHQISAAAVIAVDQSPALLAVVRDRLATHRRLVLVAADFHQLPLASGILDIAVAAFCLYHSTHPVQVVAEIARCLRPGRHLVLATKAEDSYHAVDKLIAASGLDPDATARPSLYQTFHTSNAEQVVTAAGLTVQERLDQEHRFRFADLDHLAEYAATSPKYRLPSALTAEPRHLAAALRRRLPDRPITTTSAVTYLIAARP